MPPGSGWPGDPADAATPVASTVEDVRRLAGAAADLDALTAEVSVCRACPRLVAWREDVAVRKRASFAGEPYWGRPIHGWGAESPSVLIVGLAPAANGGNRTGRIFTGDRSGDWLVAGMHRVGLATQPTSVHAADGLELIDTRMVAAVRCAPPQNKPTPEERDTCAPWLDRELTMVASSVRVMVVLGGFGWDAALGAFRRLGWTTPLRKPRFGHGVEVEVHTTERGPEHPILLLGCYHPSQQNTFTGRLTEPMLDDVLGRAASAARLGR